jgi:hypothetical protein
VYRNFTIDFAFVGVNDCGEKSIAVSPPEG